MIIISEFVGIPNFQSGMNLLTVLSCIYSVSFAAAIVCSKNGYMGFVGDDILLHCNITNVLRSNWRRNTTNLIGGKTDLNQSDNVGVLIGNYSLIVHSLCLDDEGIYECTQDNTVVSTNCLNVMCYCCVHHE